jgi:fluoride exporter
MPSHNHHGELPADPDVPAPPPPHRRPVAWILVILGAAIGATIRIAAEHMWPAKPGDWPTTTFAINVVGSFVLGAALQVLARLGPDDGWRQNVRMVAATGVCSTLTTYSAMALEITMLIRAGYVATAVAYAVASVLAGSLVAWIGMNVVALPKLWATR